MIKKTTKISLRQNYGDAKRRQNITKKMTIGEVIKRYPKSVFVFLDYGLNCVGCPMAEPETVEEAAKLHRIDLKSLLRDLNKITKKNKK